MTAHRHDLESDLSAIHHIPDPLDAPARRMFGLSQRIAHYPGVIRNLAAAERRTQAPAPRPAPAAPAEETVWIPSTPAALARSPMARYFSFGGDPQE